MIDKVILEFMKQGKFYAKKLYHNENVLPLDYMLQHYFAPEHRGYTQLDSVLPAHRLYVLVRADLLEDCYEENFYRRWMPE